MKVSGFTFIRNAEKYDYPIVEAISSILPLCDEVVVAVGNSEDATRSLVEALGPKIRIIDTVWDDELREGGRVLAIETDKALAAIAPDADWAIYIQGDECFHENDHLAIRAGMEKWKNHPEVEGLLFNYLHFYGSFDYVGASSRWYQREIRIVRPQSGVFSYKDAQGFRKFPNEKLKVKKIDATVHHYGWVKPPDAMQRKQQAFHRLWHDDAWLAENVGNREEFDYSGIDWLQKFEGTHPKVMIPRIEMQNWKFDHDLSVDRRSFKEKAKQTIKRLLGWEIGYKNYRILR
jgi:glycosyltransferase involved in cell wall biosynthesis